MSDAVAHTLDGCEVQPLGEELNPEREELLVDMDVVRERGLDIINTTAYIAITGILHTLIPLLVLSRVTGGAGVYPIRNTPWTSPLQGTHTFYARQNANSESPITLLSLDGNRSTLRKPTGDHASATKIPSWDLCSGPPLYIDRPNKDHQLSFWVIIIFLMKRAKEFDNLLLDEAW